MIIPHWAKCVMLLITAGVIGNSNAQILPGSNGTGNHAVPESRNSLRGDGMKFTQNKGQIVDTDEHLRPDILFKGEGGNADAYIRKTGISYVLSNISEVLYKVDEQVETRLQAGEVTKQEGKKIKQELLSRQLLKLHRVDVDFENCNLNAEIQPEDKVEGYTNYYLGHCPQGITDVNSYNELTVKNIYNNIDVKYYGAKEKGLKYDIVVNPGADPAQIRLKYSGAEKIKLKNGRLQIETSLGTLGEYIPKVYQQINGLIVDVPASYQLIPGRRGEAIVGFKFSSQDGRGINPAFPLVIDPWVTYYGGSNIDQGEAIAADANGNVCFTGYTLSNNFPVLAGFQMVIAGNTDVFVVKFNSAGARLWATYYGGNAFDVGSGIRTDGAGNILVTGYAVSANFPVFAGYQMAFRGVEDAFVIKFTPAGTRLWATYYGGTGDDAGFGITIDPGGNVLITGMTQSANFPVLGGFQMALSGSQDMFIVKFNGAGTRLWATYYGGTSSDQGTDITTDPGGNIFVTGSTFSANFPILSAHQAVSGGSQEGFVVAFTGAGIRLWATYYGGSNGEYCNGITTDSSGNIYITGYTLSNNLPVFAGFQMVMNGGEDSFVVKFTGAGVRVWATYLGGSLLEEGWGIACDGNDDIVVSGDTYSTDFPVTSCAYQTTFIGSEDQYIAKFDPTGNLLCSGFIGSGITSSPNNEDGHLAVYGCYVYLLATTVCTYPVTAGAFQTTCAGNRDCALAQLYLSTCGGITSTLNFLGDKTNICAGQKVNYTSTYSSCADTTGTTTYKWSFTGGVPTTSTSPNPAGITYNAAGTYNVKLVIYTPCGKDSITKTNYINVTKVNVTATPTNVSCKGAGNGSISASPSGGTTPYVYVWNVGQTASTAINLGPGTYTVTVIDSKGCTSTSTATLTEPAGVTATSTQLAVPCGGANGSATVISGGGTGAYTYVWSTGAVTQTITGLSSGIYTVTVKDSKGCTITASVSITQSLAAQFRKGKANCAGCDCKEWILVTASGGISPYSYSWPALGGYDKRYQNKLCPGTYTINIKDKNGCNINVDLSVP